MTCASYINRITSDLHLVTIMVLFLSLLGANVSTAQSGVSIVYAPSKVIKHRENLRFDVPRRTNEFRLAYTFQTDGSVEWQRYWKSPRIAINALWVDFGDPQVLGHAIALLPELHFTLRDFGDLRLNMQFGTGIAYLNKPFNEVTNPLNNAIGSNLNNTSSLKFGFDYDWTPQWSTSISGGLVHFSNGLSSSPNSGINIYGLSLGTVYRFAAPVKEPTDPLIETRSAEEPAYRKWIGDIQYHYGFTEHTTPGGPKFGVQAISIGAGYRYSKYMTILAGGEYEYNDATYTYFSENFYTEAESRKRAQKTIAYIENEFRFGPVFNRFRLGFYLGWPAVNNQNTYIKMVTGINLPKIANVAQPYIGVVLKTHTAVADYLAVMGGVRF